MAIPAYYSLLHRGSSGPDVAMVQTWLNGVRDACTWHDPLKADGKFGLSTENAVKEFQLKNKMNVDGKVGANTWNVLYTQLHRQAWPPCALPRYPPPQWSLRGHRAAGAAEAQLSG